MCPCGMSEEATAIPERPCDVHDPLRTMAGFDTRSVIGSRGAPRTVVPAPVLDRRHSRSCLSQISTNLLRTRAVVKCVERAALRRLALLRRLSGFDRGEARGFFVLHAVQDLGAGHEDRAPIEVLQQQRGALATVRQFERLGEWKKWAGSVSFVDEEDQYAAAQLWLSDWELCRGKELLAIAQHLLRQIEPLQMKAAGSSASAVPAPRPASEGS